MIKRLLLMFAALVGDAAEADTSHASVQELVKGRIGLVRLPLNAPLYIGVEKGFFRNEGLDIQLNFFDAASAVPAVVVSGDVDIGLGGRRLHFTISRNLKSALPYYDRQPEVDVADMSRQLAIWQELGVAPKSADIKTMVDLSFSHGHF